MRAGGKAFAPGEELAGFTIVRQLGEGGMGVVYLARDESLSRVVALKVIAPHLADDAEFQRRFAAEARHAAAIDHPNAVPVYSTGTSDGHLFIAMRYVNGSDLRQELAAAGPLDAATAVRVSTEIAAALDAAHAAGLVHRDVKPANILLTDPGREGTSYLTDFGLTRDLGGTTTQLTASGHWIGTLDYVAPEQLAGRRIDARTDIYALGCVLYEMIAGTVPFQGDEMRKLWSKANEDTPPLPSPDPPHPLDPVIARATAREPNRRFKSAGDLGRAAAAALGQGGQPTERSVAVGPAASPGEPAEAVTARLPRAPRPVPPAPPPSSGQDSGRSGGRGQSVAIVAGAVGLAVGLVVAALLVVHGADRTSGGVTTTSASGSSAAAGGSKARAATSSAAAPGVFEGARYSVEPPAGWSQIETEKLASDNSYWENKWRSPDGSEEVLIDDSPGNPADPGESAASIGSGVSDSGETVHRIADGVVYGGIEGSELAFRADSDPRERVDFFFDLGGSGFAALSSGPSLAAARSRLGPLLASLSQNP